MKAFEFVRSNNMLLIGLQNDWEIQLSVPNFSKSSYGYGLHLKTAIVVGRRAFALTLLGFGFAIAQDNLNTLVRRDKIKSKQE